MLFRIYLHCYGPMSTKFYNTLWLTLQLNQFLYYSNFHNQQSILVLLEQSLDQMVQKYLNLYSDSSVNPPPQFTYSAALTDLKIH